MSETQKKMDKMPGSEADYVTIGDAIVYATNLIFSCEVYLKTLLALDGKLEATGHNLWALFNAISKNRKDILEAEYKSELARSPHQIEINLLLTNKTYSDREYSEVGKRLRKKHDGSLRNILIMTGDSYQSWRYIAQMNANKDKEILLTLPRVHLLCLCNATDRLISSILIGTTPATPRPIDTIAGADT
jgi:hypothetical protein